MEIYFKPRESQQRILEYESGTMGISAVPGSGKTHILSALAAKIVTSGKLGYDQEVLVVTLVNSAVDNFSSRISKFIKIKGLVPNIGYRVRTLHGLAHDILKENPSLAGLENGFSIIDEKDAEQIRREIIKKWILEHPNEVEDLLAENLDPSTKRDVLDRHLPFLLENYCLAFTRTAKDLRKTASAIKGKIDDRSSVMLRLGSEIFEAYQRALSLRGAVDFDDLIGLALTALENSPELLARLQNKFPYILEDEAQDSSMLQERILSLLSTGNWVRVGDPNQAIFETFTTAKPEYLKNFIKKADYHVDLPESGRCQPSIIFLANELINWVNSSHPDYFCRDALIKPFIRPTGENDPQRNPPDSPGSIFLIENKFNSNGELEAIAKSLSTWLAGHQDQTVAVLLTTNKRGVDLINMLKERRIEYVEYLISSTETRVSTNKITVILEYLDEPNNNKHLLAVFDVFMGAFYPDISPQEFPIAWNVIKKLDHPESIFDLEFSGTSPESESVTRILEKFCLHLNRWTQAIILPIDQMFLTIGQDISRDAIEMVLFHKLAFYLRQGRLVDPNWGLKESILELAKISKNERKFLSISREDTNFDPSNYPGKVVVTTIHKAKGLEWDKIYLTSVNNYDFPSLTDHDTYYSEKYFIKEKINLEAEGIFQLRKMFDEKIGNGSDSATVIARREFVKERLRLLYVAITRAKREIAITWNTGRRNQTMAIPFEELIRIWKHHGTENELDQRH